MIAILQTIALLCLSPMSQKDQLNCQTYYIECVGVLSSFGAEQKFVECVKTRKL